MSARKLGRKILKGAVDTARKMGGFVAGFISALVALMLSKFGCAILVIAFVVLMVVAILVVKARRLSPGGKAIVMVVSTIIIGVIAYLLCNHFHNLHKVETVAEAPVVETVEETTELPESVEEETTEEKTSVEFERNYLDSDERKDCIDLNNERDNLSQVTTEVKSDSEDDLKYVHEEKTDDKIIEEARQDDTKEVTDMKEDIVAVTEKEEKTEEKEDSKEEVKTEEKVEIPENTVEIPSEESKEEITEESSEEVVEEKEEEKDFEDMTDEELENLFFETTIETTVEVETETVVEEVEVENEDSTDVEIKIENIEKNEEISNDEIVIEDVKNEIETEVEEEKAPEVEEVVTEKEITVAAIDGYETIVGSSVQFKIDGDNAVIEGLDGIDYTFSNGILTVEVGNEATIISVCVSNSVNSVDFQITVNGIIQ